MAKNIITGIDIGNFAIKTVMAHASGSSRPQIIGVGVSPSNGLRKGIVVDAEEAAENIKNSLVQAETVAGLKIKRAYVSISGAHVRGQVSRGVIAVSRADNEISEHDIQRVITAASTISLPPNREIIHVLPKKFIVDGQEFIKNPAGMTGIRLEADVTIIDALSPYLKSLAKIVNANNVEVAEFVFAPLAAAQAVLNKKIREHGALSLDIGGGLCNLAVYEEGDLIYTASLPIGSKNITNDLAIVIKTSLENAERIKLEHGFIGNEFYTKKDIIDLSGLTEEENLAVPKKVIGDVISDRVSEIVELVLSELKKINRAGLLPGGVTVSGGGSKLTGLTAYVKEKLKLPARTLSNYELDGLIDQINDPSFAVAVGLMLWGVENEFRGKEEKFYDKFGTKNLADKIKNWLKNFLP